MASSDSSPYDVPAGERGQVRVFALSMTKEQADGLQDRDALATALGAGPVALDRVEVFPVANLDGLGLAGYLVDGCGVPEAEVAPDRMRLDALEGHVMLLYSKAFGDHSVTLRPIPDLTLVGTYAEDRPDWSGTPIETESALPYSGPPRKSPRQARSRSRRVGAIVFFCIMALLAVVILALIN